MFLIVKFFSKTFPKLKTKTSCRITEIFYFAEFVSAFQTMPILENGSSEVISKKGRKLLNR